MTKPANPDFQAALAYIHNLENYEISAPETIPADAWQPWRMEKLLALIGNPQQNYPIIHIAGSKGKGSTAAMCTQILMEAGLRTGLYCSPHLIDFRERIQINRQLITADEIVTLVEEIKPHAQQVPGLTWFELLTALSLWQFQRADVDVAVIEVGLGGRLDATNVVTPVVSVITRLMLDHTQLLGDTLIEIAGEKAAIIKPNVPVVSAPQHPDALTVIDRAAARNKSPLTCIADQPPQSPSTHTWQYSAIQNEDNATYQLHIQRGNWQGTYPLLPRGHFQVENAATAVAAIAAAQPALPPITSQAIARGLANTRWRGRFETLTETPLTIVDGAHNVQAIQMLVGELNRLSSGPVWTFIFGCMADKDIDGMLATLLPITKRVILSQAHHPRALPADKLLAQAQATITASNRPDISLTSSPDLHQAFDLARSNASPTDLLCITGSLAVAGDALLAWDTIRTN